MKFFELAVVEVLLYALVLLCVEVSAVTHGHRSERAPHHAYVSYTAIDGSGYYGGGSLISNLHVITAAHIISTFTRWSIGLGSGDFTQLRFHSTDRAFLHPNYNQQSPRDSDIGILLLSGSVTFSADIAPIALPAMGISLPLENEEVLLRGFGQTDEIRQDQTQILLSTWTRVLANDLCRNVFGVITPNHFCCFDPQLKSNICNGDMGGGLTVMYKGVETLVGINSIIMGACSAVEPAAFTRISTQRQWIRDVTNI